MSSAVARIFLLAAAATPALGFCGSHTHLAARAEGEAVEVNTFGYFGQIGPLNWVGLDPAANALCATGTRQSPINMVEGQFTLVPASDVVLEIPDQPEGITFENLGTTIEGVMEGKGGKLEMNGVEFELKQFHVHHPAEHIDNGVSVEMEIHNVFESADGQIAVLGVYAEVDLGTPVSVVQGKRDVANRRRNLLAQLQAGQNFTLMPSSSIVPQTNAVSSNLYETLFQSVEQIAAPGTKVTSQPLVFSELVETLKAGSFQAYSGSLTTPPCSEGVNWMVATQKVKLSPATIQRVVNVVGFNARFPQNALGQPNVLSFATGTAAPVAEAPAAAPVAEAPAAAPVAEAPAAVPVVEAPAAAPVAEVPAVEAPAKAHGA
ncbi:hypothetical protein JX265_008410 [Neoarthrinium moseri]|uniref:carbonic anhydrase n=1 Tax=Neoarthrinium moseri TaxID=1658444 RepID=A0A9P9WI73_9PEZI|nr:hypothetical protein JX266_008798 [Neoarthrinium moseri]KAI1864686.1 hypothetical protein JX265_008410 [Neoarthrinium moseri]